jgi:hypothetical protein
MLALVLETSKKLMQSSGGTLRHKVLPLGSLEYKLSWLEVQAKQLGAQASKATALEMPWASRHSL